MVDKKQIEETIVSSFHIDEEGLKDVKVMEMSKLISLGIEDIPAFLQGVLDAENDRDVEDTSVDYIKGYRYGKTGLF